MRRMIMVWIMIFAIASAAEIANAIGEYICIDPGHGGPGASQYGSDGLIQGTWGPVYQLSEQWVNLQVALGRETSQKILAGCLKIIKLM